MLFMSAAFLIAVPKVVTPSVDILNVVAPLLARTTSELPDRDDCRKLDVVEVEVENFVVACSVATVLNIFVVFKKILQYHFWSIVILLKNILPTVICL
jgi:hypothetical protein